MNAVLATIAIALILVASLWFLHLFAFIAEYQKNPVIALVEEMRKKHRNTNEN